jgi:hypothetical protein
MTRLASSFAILYAEKASYLAASTGCPEIGSDASSCAFKTQLTGLDLLKDPGSFHYVINRVPDKDNFGVSFQLERRHGTLAAGKHTLSKIGVQ